MKEDKLSFNEVEQLLSELAQHDCAMAARDNVQTELMRGAVRREIRRIFFRRRCLRMAGSVATIVALGGAMVVLFPELESQAPALASSLNFKQKSAPIPHETCYECKSAPNPPIGYTTTICEKDHACEVVIYAVPL